MVYGLSVFENQLNLQGIIMCAYEYIKKADLV